MAHLTPAQQNVRTHLAPVVDLLARAQQMTDTGHWQASLAYFTAAEEQIRRARELAQRNASRRDD